MIEFQTRSEENGLRNLATLAEAFKQAEVDRTIWKISFTIPETNEKVRLVKNSHNDWEYQSIMPITSVPR